MPMKDISAVIMEKTNPTVTAIDELISKMTEAWKNIYSLTPIPENENIDNTDDTKKVMM